MSFLKLNGVARAALVALAVLAASFQAARAETIVLTCHGVGAPFLLKLNTDNDTVSDGLHAGTSPARFTDEEITWDENPQWYFRFSLNRITGNLHGVSTDVAGGATWDWQCHKGEKQF